MNINTLKDMLQALPDCDWAFLLKDVTPRGIRYVREEMENFISPNFSLSEERDGSKQCQVLVISAPGAVGKTTLSQVLAFRKKSLLWDLAASDPIASGSLDGKIFNALRNEALKDFKDFMLEGMQFVVIDALDEGSIKVNEAAFTCLYDDIAKAIKSETEVAKGICFVLLGRSQAAEDAWLELDDRDVNALLLSIKPFDRSQANEYINNRISPNKRTPVFEECRELIFDRLAFSTVEDNEENASDDFLHYPPTLDAIVALLDGESNLSNLRDYLADGANGSRNKPLGLLHEVMSRILEREQKEKFLPIAKKKLAERASQQGWNQWDSLYSDDEQCKRLLAKVLNTTPNATPESLPSELKGDYEQVIDEWISQHPFLQHVGEFANSVFQSYLYARALRGETGQDLNDRVTRELLDPQRLSKKTRLLAEFYLYPVDADSPRGIMPEHVGILYDSLCSSETKGTHLGLSIEGSDPIDGVSDDADEHAEGEFEISSFDGKGELSGDPHSIPFSLRIERDSKISFTNSLRDASITVPCTVEIGVGSPDAPEFALGPSVRIASNKLEINSESLRVGGKAKPRPNEEADSAVILEARDLVSRLTDRPNVHGSFFVSWPGSERYPWTEFHSERLTEASDDDDSLHKAYIRFRRIAGTLRSHGRGSLARTAMKIENARVSKGPMGKRLLDGLVHDGILELHNNRYFWNSEKADALLGVSWGNLNQGQCPPKLEKYLSDFIEQNPSMFS